MTEWDLKQAALTGQDVWLVADPSSVAFYKPFGFVQVLEGVRCNEPQYILQKSSMKDTL